MKVEDQLLCNISHFKAIISALLISIIGRTLSLGKSRKNLAEFKFKYEPRNSLAPLCFLFLMSIMEVREHKRSCTYYICRNLAEKMT